MRFNTGILRKRFQKTQAECINSREKKVTELSPLRFAGIPFSNFEWFAPGFGIEGVCGRSIFAFCNSRLLLLCFGLKFRDELARDVGKSSGPRNTHDHRWEVRQRKCAQLQW